MSLKHTVEEIKLSNGTQGIVVNIPGVHTVYMTFSFRAGAQYVTQDLCQVPHLIEHLAFTNPGALEGQEAFSREFTKNSASEDASTDEVHITYEAICSLSEYERIVGLMGDVIARPTFTEKSFSVEKSTILEELNSRLNNDNRIYWQMANRMSGGSGYTDQEKIDSLDTTTVADVREFYATSHVSDNLRFVIAGDIDARTVSTQLKTWPLARGERPSIRQDTFRTLPNPVVLQRPEYGSLDFSLSLLTPGLLDHEEDVAWAFVHHLLFQTYHSRIFGKLRSKGVCYDIGSSYMNIMNNYRELEVYGSASSENIEETMAVVVQEFRKLATGSISLEDIEDVRAYIAGFQERRFEAPGDVAAYYENQYLLSGSYVKDQVILDIIKTISAETIVRYVRKWLADSAMRFGVTGNVDEAQAKKLQVIANQLKDEV